MQAQEKPRPCPQAQTSDKHESEKTSTGLLCLEAVLLGLEGLHGSALGRCLSGFLHFPTQQADTNPWAGNMTNC